MKFSNEQMIEYNKMIAEFMGIEKPQYEQRDEYGRYYDYYIEKPFNSIKWQEIQIEGEDGWALVETGYIFNEDLAFDSDWNWLIPVIDKIYNDNDYNWKYFSYNGSIAKIGRLEITTSINDTYEEVVNFIKYKNGIQ
jgi:hypothetical protein